MTRRCVVVCVALTLIAACGGDGPTSSTNAPAGAPLTLTFNASQLSQGHFVLMNGAQVYACDFSFAVTATGGATTAFDLWTDGEIDFRLTSNGAQSSQFLGGTDLQDWFGSDRILPNGREVAARSLAWSGPFTANVVFRYLDADTFLGPGASHSAHLAVSC